jgi:hypothetical protein
MASEFLAVGDALGGCRADFDESVLHFLDHQPDDFLRVLGFFQHGVDIGVHDVTEAGKNTHVVHSWQKGFRY